MRNFKKILFLVLCLALMLTFIACGDDESGQSSSASESDSVMESETQKSENAVTVKFDTQGGTQIDDVCLSKGDNVPKPSDPEKAGYTFDGWYADSEKWSFVDNAVIKDMTLVAKWTPIEYTIAFSATDISPITYTAEDTVSLPNIIAESGYAFVGWFEDEALTKPIPKIEKGSYGNKILYAKNVPLKFTLAGNSYSLTGCDHNAKTITIPSTYDGKSVTSIGDGAFLGCDSLTSIDIPSGIVAIAQKAFLGCSKLESITIPNTVKSLRHFAFSGCSSLKSLTIPSSVTEIGWGAFDFCSSLESIIIPSKVTEMGQDVFRDCKSLTIYCEATIKPSEWVLSWNPDELPVYWYSEIKPVTSGGNYWHYGANGEIVVWE